MFKVLNFIAFLFFTAACLLSCVTVRVYNDPNQPEYSFNNNKLPDTTLNFLKVVTFNIKKAEKIELALTELQHFEQLANADIYLLQEMDEKGVAYIADSLHLNYLYIPIVYNKLLKKDIGNAILTRGSIEHPEKLFLPHKKWLSKWRRDITIGEVTIHQKKILVFSVHRETIMMRKKNRINQTEAVIEHAILQHSDYDYMVIGGDFNTLFAADAKRVVVQFKDKGFDWATGQAGKTASAFFGIIKPRLDYIFTRGLTLVTAGKVSNSKSSDHYPVFATFNFKCMP